MNFFISKSRMDNLRLDLLRVDDFSLLHPGLDGISVHKSWLKLIFFASFYFA